MDDKQDRMIRWLRNQATTIPDDPKAQTLIDIADEFERIAQEVDPTPTTVEERKQVVLSNPEQRYWRGDLRTGRSIYVLISNDVNEPSEHDPMIGTMESSELAETVIDTHNAALTKYGRRYLGVLKADL